MLLPVSQLKVDCHAPWSFSDSDDFVPRPASRFAAGVQESPTGNIKHFVSAGNADSLRKPIA